MRFRLTHVLEMEVFAVVCDGVTLGHPTCGVAHCKEPLPLTKSVFCPIHKSHEDYCRVVGCNASVTSGSKTFADEEHKASERRYYEVGEAAFKLKQRSE